VSLYGLTAEPATPLGRWVRAGRESLPAEDAYEHEYMLAARVLTDAGYAHYEVSNFARPGRESRHNAAYWNGVAYLGLGPGAHSYRPPERSWNVRDWAAYAERLRAGALPRESAEVVDAEASALERVGLGLRTTSGVPAASAAQGRLAEEWRDRGWAELGGGRVRLTPSGWLLLDRLAVEFDAAAA
jgi:oxygen-independent coproporphyrinogen-3 oxidase